MPQITELWQRRHHYFALVVRWGMKQCFTVVRHARWGDENWLCDSAHSWRLYSAALLGDLATSTVTCYSTQSHYPDTEPTSPCSILIMRGTRLGSNKYQFKSHWWFDSSRVRNRIVRIRIHDLQIPRSPRRGGGCSTHSAKPTGCWWHFCTLLLSLHTNFVRHSPTHPTTSWSRDSPGWNLLLS